MPLKPQTALRDKRNKLDKQQAFLTKLAECASVNRACRATKISTALIDQWLGADAAFKQKYSAACKAALQSLEDEAVRRAFHGTPKPVYYQGKKVATVREFSDTLLMALLKGKALGSYKDLPAADTAEEKPKPKTVFKWGDRELEI